MGSRARVRGRMTGPTVWLRLHSILPSSGLRRTRGTVRLAAPSNDLQTDFGVECERQVIDLASAVGRQKDCPAPTQDRVPRPTRKRTIFGTYAVPYRNAPGQEAPHFFGARMRCGTCSHECWITAGRVEKRGPGWPVEADQGD